jgi:hypothetical protein
MHYISRVARAAFVAATVAAGPSVIAQAPAPADAGAEMLDGLDRSVFAALSKTIEAKSAPDFAPAYQQAMDGCNSCHAAAEKPFLRLHLPEQPEARIIEFTPAQ